MTLQDKNWLALTIGNSRLHWAWFTGKTLDETWDTAHLSNCELEKILPHHPSPNPTGRATPNTHSPTPIPLVLASVVPQQTAIWQSYPDVRIITLDQLPLEGLYPTLGIDRALAILGAREILGLPALVIDAGTALTFTGADAHHRLVGGAILPGLGLQFRSLTQKTAALPAIELPEQLPPRWALNTPEAIQSGIIYTLIAGIRDYIEAWMREFPGSHIAITGGDRTPILTYLQHQFPEVAAKVIPHPHLIFLGMRALVMGNGC